MQNTNSPQTLSVCGVEFQRIDSPERAIENLKKWIELEAIEVSNYNRSQFIPDVRWYHWGRDDGVDSVAIEAVYFIGSEVHRFFELFPATDIVDGYSVCVNYPALHNRPSAHLPIAYAY